MWEKFGGRENSVGLSIGCLDVEVRMAQQRTSMQHAELKVLGKLGCQGEFFQVA